MRQETRLEIQHNTLQDTIQEIQHNTLQEIHEQEIQQETILDTVQEIQQETRLNTIQISQVLINHEEKNNNNLLIDKITEKLDTYIKQTDYKLNLLGKKNPNIIANTLQLPFKGLAKFNKSGFLCNGLVNYNDLSTDLINNLLFTNVKTFNGVSSGNVTLEGDSTVLGVITAKGFNGVASGNVPLIGDSSIDGVLSAKGFNGVASGNVPLIGDSSIIGVLTASCFNGVALGNVSLRGDSIVNGVISAKGFNGVASGNVTLEGDSIVNGVITAKGFNGVANGNVTLEGDSIVNGVISAKGFNGVASGNVALEGDSIVNGIITAKGFNGVASGNVSLEGDSIVNGVITAKGFNGVANGNVSLEGDSIVLGVITAKGFNGVASGNVPLIGDSSIDGILSASCFNGVASGNVPLYGNSDIDGNLTTKSLHTNNLYINKPNGLARLVNGNIISDVLSINDLSNVVLENKLYVKNSATTATSDNVPNTIVSRDDMCNFTTNIITANEFNGMIKTNNIISRELDISINNISVARFSPSGLVLNNLLSTGVVHNDSNGVLFTSLINGNDISANANIQNNSLATLTATGLVANSATTATPIMVPDAIISRDAMGNFAANIITANEFNGVVSNTLPLTGGVMTGSLSTPLLNTNLIEHKNVINCNINGKNITSIKSDGLYVNNLDGIVYASNGLLTSKLINSNDVEPMSITNNLLQPLRNSKLVENTATTATSALIPDTIVSRDTMGNFTAGIITANLNGIASKCLSLNGGILSGPLILNGCSNELPICFSNNKEVGLYATQTALNLVNNGVTNISLMPNGIIQLPHYTTGTLHCIKSGVIVSKLITGNDLDPKANIPNSCLEILTASNLVANSATSATSNNVANTIVSRDSDGGFSANVIKATLMGTASECLPLSGGTLTGTLNVNTIASPELELNTKSILTKLPNGIVHSVNGYLTTDTVDLSTNNVHGILNNNLTTANSNNVANSIVSRDSYGGFSAGVINASFVGTLSGIASGCLALTGGVLTGPLVLPAGASYNPSIRFAGSTLSGLFSGNNAICVSINSAEIAQFDAHGLTLHSLSNGLVSVLNGRLYTVDHIQNNQTSSTHLCKPNTIVSRDADSCFEMKSKLIHYYRSSHIVGGIIQWERQEPHRGDLTYLNGIFTNLPVGLYEINTNGELFVDSVSSGNLVEVGKNTTIKIHSNCLANYWCRIIYLSL